MTGRCWPTIPHKLGEMGHWCERTERHQPCLMEEAAAAAAPYHSVAEGPDQWFEGLEGAEGVLGGLGIEPGAAVD
jgi:hypothetical protein